MESQKALKFIIQNQKTLPEKNTELTTTTETITSPRKQKWRISFYRSSSSISTKPHNQPKKQNQPKEFLCPISGSLMADPVIVSSGHTFERACVHACKTLGFTPTLVDGTSPDFSAVIPNLALKSTIVKWCEKHSITPPKPLDFFSAEKLVRTLMASTQDLQKATVSERELIRGVQKNPPVKFNHAVTELTRRPTHFYSNSDESISALTDSTPPLQLKTRPSCFSSQSSSSELETINPNPNFTEEEEFVVQLKSQELHEVEEAVVSLRKITRTKEETRISLCTDRLLSALRSLILSRYKNIQVNSVAALVNLSLEKTNKVKIVRSGIVPPLIEVLKTGSPESQEHACGALFSLSLDDQNKTAIGVLGALPHLIRLLRVSESERTRHDSALALYHLTLVKSNRTKLVTLGSVPVLLGLIKSGRMMNRILLILGNLASCNEGRVAVLDSGGVACLVGMLRKGGTELSESTQERYVSVLHGLSHGGLRFKGLAKAAGMEEVLRRVERAGSEHAREKARRMLELMKGRLETAAGEEDEDVDWEELLESGLSSRTRFGKGESCVNSSEF